MYSKLDFKYSLGTNSKRLALFFAQILINNNCSKRHINFGY